MPNQLWMNQGNGRFIDEAMIRGCAVNSLGAAEAGMGVAAVDIYQRGWLDLFVTHLVDEGNRLWVNTNGYFIDTVTPKGPGAPSSPYTGFGLAFADFDNDGFKDLFVVNGHLYPQIDRLKNEIGYRQRDLYYRNIGDGRFLNLSSRLNHREHVGRGAAFGDLDNDGRVDVVVSNLDDRLNVLMNRDGSKNNWILIRCASTCCWRERKRLSRCRPRTSSRW
jgi:hypothetical protein